MTINIQNALFARLILGIHHADNQYLVSSSIRNKTLSKIY